MPTMSPITPVEVSGADQRRALAQRQQQPIVSGAASDATTAPSSTSSGTLGTVDAPGTAAGEGERIVVQPAANVTSEATGARLAQKAQDEAHTQPTGTASIPAWEAISSESSHALGAAGGPLALPPRYPAAASAAQTPTDDVAGGRTRTSGSSPIHPHQASRMSEPSKPNPLSS